MGPKAGSLYGGLVVLDLTHFGYPPILKRSEVEYFDCFRCDVKGLTLSPEASEVLGQ